MNGHDKLAPTAPVTATGAFSFRVRGQAAYGSARLNYVPAPDEVPPANPYGIRTVTPRVRQLLKEAGHVVLV